MYFNLANPVNRSCPLNRGLVHWFMPINRGVVGRSYYNLLGKYPLALTSHTWGVGRYGNVRSVVLDGSSTSYGISPTIPQISAPLSIVLRMKLTSAVNNATIMSHDSGSNNGFRIAIESSLLRLVLGGVANYTVGNFDPVNSQWVTCVVTWVGNSGTVAGYYWNHEANTYATTSTTTGTMSGTPNRLTIGWDMFAGAFSAAVQIADMRILNRVLSEQEARATMLDARIGYGSTLNWIRPVYGKRTSAAVGGHPAMRRLWGQTSRPLEIGRTNGVIF